MTLPRGKVILCGRGCADAAVSLRGPGHRDLAVLVLLPCHFAATKSSRRPSSSSPSRTHRVQSVEGLLGPPPPIVHGTGLRTDMVLR